MKKKLTTALSSFDRFLLKLGRKVRGEKLLRGYYTKTEIGLRWYIGDNCDRNVKVICDNAFEGVKGIDAVTLGYRVVVIGENAFWGAIKEIRIHGSADKPCLHIKKRAFFNLPELKSFIIPEKTAYLGEEVFGPALIELQFKGMVPPEMHPEAFKSAKGLKNIEVPTKALDVYRKVLQPFGLADIVNDDTLLGVTMTRNKLAGKKRKEDSLRERIVRIIIPGDEACFFSVGNSKIPMVLSEYNSYFEIEVWEDNKKIWSSITSAEGPSFHELGEDYCDAADDVVEWDISAISDENGREILKDLTDGNDEYGSEFLDYAIDKRKSNHNECEGELFTFHSEDNVTVELEYKVMIYGEEYLNDYDFSYFCIRAVQDNFANVRQAEIFKGVSAADKAEARFMEKLGTKAELHKQRMETVKKRRKSIDGLCLELDERMDGSFKKKNRLDLSPDSDLLKADNRVAIFDYIIYDDDKVFQLQNVKFSAPKDKRKLIRKVEI